MHLKKGQLIGGLFAIVITIVWVVVKKQAVTTQDEVVQPQQDAQSQQGGYTRESRAPSTSAMPAAVPKESATITAQTHSSVPQKPAKSPEEVEQVIEELNNVAISYDVAELPKIEPYLLHSNAEIREAAMDAMITLGDASAVPLLRKAAAEIADPREAVELLEAADFVELPPAKLNFRKKVK